MEQKEMKTGTLLKRFVPYYKKYTRIMVLDLLCASLTTVCELILPLILRYITNQGLKDLASLTVQTIVGIGVLYFALRIVDGLASFYMAYTGHVMGAAIETGNPSREMEANKNIKESSVISLYFILLCADGTSKI